MGPMTTPAIHVLLFDDKSGVGVCSVGCGVLVLELELDEATLVEVVARLEDDGMVDVEPMSAFSTKTFCSMDERLTA